MKKFILLILAARISFLSFGQYDVDIKKNQNAGAEVRQKALQEKEELGNCKYIPFYEYKEGMKFYFPRNDYKEKDDYGVMFYYYAKEAKKDEYRRTNILYKDLAGKMFVITKIEERNGIVFPDTYITLKQVDGDMEIEHKMQISRAKLKKQSEDEPFMGQVNVMPYAIYAADIDSFKEKYLGKEFYTKFQINGRKFKKVKIIQVGAGTEDAPIRVVVETENDNQDQQDICTCGTNVVSNFADLNYFLNYFLFDNPEDKYKGTDETWDLICQGKIRIGMTEEELKLSWGEPKKINETVVSGIASKQYVYDDQYVYVDNGKVTSFQSAK